MGKVGSVWQFIGTDDGVVVGAVLMAWVLIAASLLVGLCVLVVSWALHDNVKGRTRDTTVPKGERLRIGHVIALITKCEIPTAPMQTKKAVRPPCRLSASHRDGT